VLFMQMLGKVDGRSWQEALKMPGYLVMDAKSLYDSDEAGLDAEGEASGIGLGCDYGGTGQRARGTCWQMC
jgi:hypothetical protein